MLRRPRGTISDALAHRVFTCGHERARVFRFTAGKVSGDHRISVISARSTACTPTACQSRPGQGAPVVRRGPAVRPDCAASRRDDYLGGRRGGPREALEEFCAAGYLQPQLASSLALSGQVTGWLLAT